MHRALPETDPFSVLNHSYVASRRFTGEYEISRLRDSSFRPRPVRLFGHSMNVAEIETSRSDVWSTNQRITIFFYRCGGMQAVNDEFACLLESLRRIILHILSSSKPS